MNGMRHWGIALALALAACSAADDAPTNVLLVTVDTLRADHVSAYGVRRHQTPNLDRLAAEGVLFENAFTDTPWTTPSMSSVMTGNYPTRHGFKSTNANRLGLENVTLAEMLHERGYDTAAVVGSFPLDSIYQLDQGFDYYDDTFTKPIWIHPDVEFAPLPSEFRDSPEEQAMFAMAKAMNDSRRTDAEVTDAALAWLRHPHGTPFFLWVHYFGPHSKPDWRIPESKRLARELAQYDPDVRTADAEVGRLLDGLAEGGHAGDTLVVFHADHGESLGEQGYVGHGHLLNDATMRIPLILRWPRHLAAGRRVSALVRNVDILPTVLSAVDPGAETAAFSGESLLPLAGGGDPEPDGDDGLGRSTYMETYYPAHGAFATPVVLDDGSHYRVGTIRRAVRTRRWLFERSEPRPLIDVPDAPWETLPAEALARVRGEKLIDVAADPTADVSAAHPAVAKALRARLEARLAEEREHEPAPRLAPDPETRRRLKSLGYTD